MFRFKIRFRLIGTRPRRVTTLSSATPIKVEEAARRIKGSQGKQQFKVLWALLMRYQLRSIEPWPKDSTQKEIHNLQTSLEMALGVLKAVRQFKHMTISTQPSTAGLISNKILS